VHEGALRGMTSFGEAARPATQPRPCQRNPAAITPSVSSVAPVCFGPFPPLGAVFWGSRVGVGGKSVAILGQGVGFGEGLGGLPHPPNERDVSAANAEKGVWGEGRHPNGQLSTGGFRARGLEKIKEGLGKMLHSSKLLI
jgi:hypothetical protein